MSSHKSFEPVIRKRQQTFDSVALRTKFLWMSIFHTDNSKNLQFTDTFNLKSAQYSKVFYFEGNSSSGYELRRWQIWSISLILDLAQMDFKNQALPLYFWAWNSLLTWKSRWRILQMLDQTDGALNMAQSLTSKPAAKNSQANTEVSWVQCYTSQEQAWTACIHEFMNHDIGPRPEVITKHLHFT